MVGIPIAHSVSVSAGVRSRISVIMYNNMLFVVLCVLGFVKAGVTSPMASDDFRVIDSIYDEHPCTAQGGLCTIAVDCPTGHLVEQKGLCLEQQSKGVECCYGLSVKETRCEKRGGMCIRGQDPCNKVVRFTEVTDCPNNTTCCIMLS